MIEPVGDNDAPLFDVDPIDLTSDEADTPQHLAGRIHDRREIQVAGRNFVQHGREQEKILPIHEGNLDMGVPAEFLLQLHGNCHPRKTSPRMSTRIGRGFSMGNIYSRYFLRDCFQTSSQG
jgi:hypothetical protein